MDRVLSFGGGLQTTALALASGQELERFDLGTVLIGRQPYTVLTGYEGQGVCFWCGGELKGKLKRYCRGHMKLYYEHYEWGHASWHALQRAGRLCENCGAGETLIRPYQWSARTNLEVHHIVPLNGSRRYFSAFNLPWNLVVLCHDCHQEIHAAMRPEPLLPPTTHERRVAAGQLELILPDEEGK